MALQVQFTAPGGFKAENGYRRLMRLNVDFVLKTVQIDAADYKDHDWRERHPSSTTGGPSYQLAMQSKPSQPIVIFDDSGEGRIGKTDPVPSGAEFLSQPISTYLPEVAADMTIGELLAGICYGYAKTRSENKGAVDV